MYFQDAASPVMENLEIFLHQKPIYVPNACSLEKTTTGGKAELRRQHLIKHGRSLVKMCLRGKKHWLSSRVSGFQMHFVSFLILTRHIRLSLPASFFKLYYHDVSSITVLTVTRRRVD